MDVSLRETNGRLKLLRQPGGRITAKGTQVDEYYQERYPLHVKDPNKSTTPACPLDWLKIKNQEDLEEKTAKQDLARVYFTTEATRLVACANLTSLERNTNIFNKMDTSRRPRFPHFFMDRLAEDVETENKRKQEQRLTAIRSEMDAFDESLKGRPTTYTMRNFDPLQPSSEKSLNNLKLKIEIMKQQRERDVQAASARNRTRKSYFQKMLPCLADVLRNDLMDYSIKRASRLSGEEMILAGDLLLVAKQRNVLEEHRRKYEKDEELLTEEADGEELEHVEEDEEQRDEDDAGRINTAHPFKGKNATEKCSGPSHRKTLVYEELGNISYGMNWSEHEKPFLKHRSEELKQLSETWYKGLQKPANIYTTREKNYVPFSKQLSGKRKPPFNILDPTISRPKFNLRMENLIRRAEQAKLEQHECIEAGEKQASKEQVQVTEPTSVNRACAEMLKGISKRRPSWQDEIAEYECRRKEREKLMAESKVVEDPAKELGFYAFYNESPLCRTFIRIADNQLEDNEEQEIGNSSKKSSLARRKTSGCTPTADASIPDGCDVAMEAGGLEQEDDTVHQNSKCDEQEECLQFTTKYMEIPGEGYYDLNLDFPQQKDEDDRFSIQEVYNE